MKKENVPILPIKQVFSEQWSATKCLIFIAQQAF
jgi:hypothetical protein